MAGLSQQRRPEAARFGPRVENASEGITLQLDKTAQPAAPLICYVYLLMDAQLNIEIGRAHV